MSAQDATMFGASSTGSNVDGATESHKVSRFDTCFAYFALIVFSSAIADPIRVLRGIPEPPPGTSDPVIAFSQFLILFVLACILLTRWRSISLLFRHIVPYMLLLAICVTSSLWSEFPLITARRSIAFGACLMFGVYCYDAFGLARIVGMVARLAMVLAVLSIIFFVTMPSIGLDPTIGSYNAMRGVFPHKNLLSIFMVLGIVCQAYSVVVEKKLFAFAVSVPLLYLSILLSESASSLVAATIVLTLTGLLYLPERSAARVLFWFFLTSAVTAFVFFALLFPDAVFNALGRDASLTGRLPLWGLVIDAISDRPFLGYGYAGFWNADSRDTQYIWSQADWLPAHAHNGYLEITLEIGLVSLAIVVWMWGRTIRLALNAKRSGTRPSGSWVLLFVFLIALLNIDENQLPANDTFNALMPAAMIEVGVWNDRRKRAATRARWTGRRPDLGAAQIAAPGHLAARPSFFMATFADQVPETDPQEPVG